jgi:geranylgeranyl pyrophosphate synthase
MSPMVDLPDDLQRHVAALEEFYEEEIARVAYPFLSDGVAYQFATGGKRLRPALCLVACEALGGDPRAALRFAMATEVLHNFLLVHDDIEDGDTMRRDQETLWTRIGVPNALNVADFLIARAYRLILEAPLPCDVSLRLARSFTIAFQRTVEGQALDINLRGSSEVDLATYYRIVTLKTAYYLALPWVGGAIVAGTRDGDLEPLWELGRCLGPAFQIRDDLIDLTRGKGRGGEIGCDIREGKPSICFAYVLETRRGSETERRRLIETLKAPREKTTDADIAWVIGFYEKEGVLRFAQAEAERLAARSEAVLEELPFAPAGKESFRAMIRFIVERQF